VRVKELVHERGFEDLLLDMAGGAVASAANATRTRAVPIAAARVPAATKR
jgi:hypothetical protein